MKAEIDERGCLTISAQTPLESYALARWHEGWGAPAGQQRSLLMIGVTMRDAPGMTEGVRAVPAPLEMANAKVSLGAEAPEESAAGPTSARPLG